MTLSPQTIFDCLIGGWTIERTVTNGTRMTGTGMFTLIDADSADYHETIRSLLPTGEALDGTQDYIFHRLPSGFETRFKLSGQVFHQMEFSVKDAKLATRAIHRCPPDIYESLYEFESNDKFRVNHEIFGPRKDHMIHSLYTRIAS